MDPTQQSCDTFRPSGIIQMQKLKPGLGRGPFQDPWGRQRQEWDSNPNPLCILHTPPQQELGEGRKDPCPCLAGVCPTGGLGWRQGSGRRAGSLLCVLTEDVPVVQEHIPEARHLVTFISAASAFTGSA